MKIKEDLTNRKFGRLTVIGRDQSKVGFERGSFWLCICECGQNRSISRQGLVNHGAKSCGCLQREVAMSMALPNAKADKNSWINKYKNRAKTLKFEFSLAEEEFFKICSSNCFYCNSTPIPRNHCYERKNNTGTFVANGIDRVNPDKGYTSENSVPCCTICNLMKTNKSMEEFISKAIQIADKHRRKEDVAS